MFLNFKRSPNRRKDCLRQKTSTKASAVAAQGMMEGDTEHILYLMFANLPATCAMIFDGHGGTDCVEYLEAMFMPILENEITQMFLQNMTSEGFLTKHLDDIIPDAISAAFQICDQNFVRMQRNSGSTCAMILTMFDPYTGRRTVYTAHLGDTRAVLVRSGIACRLTSWSDHRATDPEEQKGVQARGGHILDERVNGSLSVTRAFGDHFLKAPLCTKDIVPIIPSITAVDLDDKTDPFIILGCDGLFDVMTDQEAAALVAQGWQHLKYAIPGLTKNNNDSTMAEILARVLVEAALQRGSTDNVTAQVILL